MYLPRGKIVDTAQAILFDGNMHVPMQEEFLSEKNALV